MAASNTKIAGIATVVLSLTTAGYQFNKAEMAEMQSTVKAMMAENKAVQIERDSKNRLEQEAAKKAALVAEAKNAAVRLANLNSAAHYLIQMCGKFPSSPRKLLKACNTPETLPAMEAIAKESPQPFVLIQIKKGDLQASKEAIRIRDQLLKQNYKVPEIEEVHQTIVRNELRYVHAEDKDKMNELLVWVNNANSMHLKREFVASKPMPAYEKVSPHNVAELWLSSLPDK